MYVLIDKTHKMSLFAEKILNFGRDTLQSIAKEESPTESIQNQISKNQNSKLESAKEIRKALSLSNFDIPKSFEKNPA